jgi:hypothetical protein
MRRVKAMLWGVATTGALSSCAVHGSVGRADLTATPSTLGRFDHFRDPWGQSVMSYTTTDGSVHAVEGKAWIEGDSMLFERGRREFAESYLPHARRRVAIADLASVEAIDEDTGATMVVVLGVVGAVVGIVYLVIHLTWGSMFQLE